MTNNLIRNSDTDPIRIDFVQPDKGWGLIGMSFCPGKKQTDARTGHWDRDLAKDLNHISAWGATMVISLIEEHEFEELQVQALAATTELLGMKWRHLPIRDRYPPGCRFQALWAEVGAEIVTMLQAGERIFLHCKGGLGRTGTVAACLLVESGVQPEEAIEKVRAARRNTIETTMQEWHVMSYISTFQ
jgi:ADP-ribosyl-[dinitrogen reductase] hydrolase